MSSRRIRYDEMRDRGLMDRCGYARELYEINKKGRFKQGCSLMDGRCMFSGRTHLPTREESYTCPIYMKFQNQWVREYELRQKS